MPVEDSSVDQVGWPWTTAPTSGAPAIDLGVDVDFHRRRVDAGEPACPSASTVTMSASVKRLRTERPLLIRQPAPWRDAGMAVEIDDAVGLEDAQRGQQIGA